MDDPSLNDQPRSTHIASQSSLLLDLEHLRQLTLFYYINGGIIAAFSSVFIFHIVMGLTMINHPHAFPTTPGAPPFPSEMGYMFVAMGSIAVLGGWILGGLTVYAGRCIKDRKNYILVLVVAGLNCFFVMPAGTILGVFTFVVLNRPSVQAIFKPISSIAAAETGNA